jgi:prepilin-type N-terminal cleavage/methylation domain-containing protein
MRRNFFHGQKGLSVIEVLVACLILAAIACIAIPKYKSLRARAAEESEQYLISLIRNGIELYRNSGLKEL